MVTGTDGPCPARTLFADLAIGQTRMLRKPRKVYAHRVYLSVLRLAAQELLIVASSQPGATALADYACRWGIEVLFAALKTRGFNLEETHLTAQARIEKLLGLLAIALTWAYLIGHWVVEAKPLTIKNHGRPACSIFRIGLDEIQYVLLNIQDHRQTFFQYLWLLLYPAPVHSV